MGNNSSIGNINKGNEDTQLSSDIISLLQSIPDQQSKNQKLELIQQIETNIRKIEKHNISSKINVELCNELLLQIGNGRTTIQKALLGIIGKITELGADLTGQYENNQFFGIFSQSKLLACINDILIATTNIDEQEGNLNDYSEFTTQLTQTVAFIYKNQTKNNNDINIFKIFGTVLRFKFNKLIRKMKNYSRDLKMNIEILKEEDNQMLFEMKDGAKLLKALEGLIFTPENRTFFEIQIVIHEVISSFIHINCTHELHCIYNIILPESIILYDLQGASFRVIGELLFQDGIKKYILKKHSAFDHISTILISFAQQQSDQQTKQYKHHHTQNQQPTQIDIKSRQHSVVAGVLYFLYRLISDDIKQCQQVASTHGFVQALITLSIFERQKDQNMKKYFQSLWIREKSSNCLGWIFWLCDNNAKKRMINKYKYAQNSIEGIACCGGNQEEGKNVVFIKLRNVMNMFTVIICGTNKQSPIPDIKQKAFEQVEEEGGSEEIEGHLYNKLEDIKHQAKGIKKQMNNTKKNITN